MALAVLAIVMLPLAMVFYWGATSSAQTRENGDAIAIANGFLSQAQSVTYADLGFYEDQFGTPPQTVPSYGGQPGVDLGAAPPAGVSAQIPVTSTPQTVGAITYAERTYVVWADASGGKSDAYKRVYAVVSWTENGRHVSVTQNVLVYPGGLGKYTGPENNTAGSSLGVPDNVAGLGAAVPSDPAGESEVTLAWTAPVDTPGFYVAVWSTNLADLAVPATSGTSGAWAPTGSTASGSIPASATSYTVTGLSSATVYWFEIVAFSSDGSQWAVSLVDATATTLVTPVVPCTLGALTVSQSGQSSGTATVAKTSGHLTQPIAISVSYSGLCTAVADLVTVTATSSGADPSSPYSLTWGATSYTYSVCPSSGFTTGTHTYTVLLNGVSSSLTAQVSFTKSKSNSSSC